MLKRLCAGAFIAWVFSASPLGLGPEIQVSAADMSVCGGPGAMKPAQNFTLQGLDGRKVSLSSFKGKVVLVDFWATWCPPCRLEIPEFIDMYTRYKDKGLEILGVSLDDDAEEIKPFAAEFKMNYPILLGAGQEAIHRAWGVFGLPTTVVVTREGKVCKKFVGQTAKEKFEEAIKKLL